MTGDDFIVMDLEHPAAEAIVMLQYLAALIYPGRIPSQRKFMCAALAYGIRTNRKYGTKDHSGAGETLRAMPARSERNRLKSAERILRRRLLAGRIFQEIALSKGTLTLDEAARKVPGSANYAIRACWAESKPVLHLATALLNCWPRRAPRDRRMDVVFLIARCNWSLEAVEAAEEQISLFAMLRKVAKPKSVFARLPTSGRIRLVKAAPYRIPDIFQTQLCTFGK